MSISHNNKYIYFDQIFLNILSNSLESLFEEIFKSVKTLLLKWQELIWPEIKS